MYSEKDIEQMKEMYETHTLREIGEKYNLSRESIRKLINPNGELTKLKAEKNTWVMPKEQLEYVLENYPEIKVAYEAFEKGMPHDQVAGLINKSKAKFLSFCSYWRTRGVPFPREFFSSMISEDRIIKDFVEQDIKRKDDQIKRQQRKENLARDYINGMENSELSEKYNIKEKSIPSTVASLKKENLIPSDFKRKRKVTKPQVYKKKSSTLKPNIENRNEKFARDVVNGFTDQELCKKYNIKERTIATLIYHLKHIKGLLPKDFRRSSRKNKTSSGLSEKTQVKYENMALDFLNHMDEYEMSQKYSLSIGSVTALFYKIKNEYGLIPKNFKKIKRQEIDKRKVNMALDLLNFMPDDEFSEKYDIKVTSIDVSFTNLIKNGYIPDSVVRLKPGDFLKKYGNIDQKKLFHSMAKDYLTCLPSSEFITKYQLNSDNVDEIMYSLSKSHGLFPLDGHHEIKSKHDEILKFVMKYGLLNTYSKYRVSIKTLRHSVAKFMASVSN